MVNNGYRWVPCGLDTVTSKARSPTSALFPRRSHGLFRCAGSTAAANAMLLAQPGRVGHAVGGAIPIILQGPLHLPGIAPHDINVDAVLRECHSVLAFLLFAMFTAHLCAVLFHTLVVHDRLLDRIALWRTKAAAPRTDETEA